MKIRKTRVSLDSRLVEEARVAGRLRTKTEAVKAALEEYVQRRSQLGILRLAGTIDYDPDYDYKGERRTPLS